MKTIAQQIKFNPSHFQDAGDGTFELVGGGGGGGEVTKYQVFTLSGGNITNKYVDLLLTPTDPTNVRFFLGGGSIQDKTVDWNLITDGISVKRVSWNGLSLDGQLIAGDKIFVVYTINTTSAAQAVNVQVDNITPFTGLLAGATEVQAALDIIDAGSLGGVTEYADEAAWEAVNRTGGPEIIDFVEQNGFYEYEPTYTDLRDGEIILDPTTGSGRGILSTPHFDGLWAYLSPEIREILPVVQVSSTVSVANASYFDITVTVPGASEGDVVVVGPPYAAVSAGLICTGGVSAEDTVKIRITQFTGSPVSLATQTFSVQVIKSGYMPAITNRGVRIFNLLMSQTYTSGTLQTDLLIVDNETDFRLMINSTWRRKALLADLAVKAIIQGSVLANAAMEDIEGIGY